MGLLTQGLGVSGVSGVGVWRPLKGTILGPLAPLLTVLLRGQKGETGVQKVEPQALNTGTPFSVMFQIRTQAASFQQHTSQAVSTALPTNLWCFGGVSAFEVRSHVELKQPFLPPSLSVPSLLYSKLPTLTFFLLFSVPHAPLCRHKHAKTEVTPLPWVRWGSQCLSRRCPLDVSRTFTWF